MPCLGVALPRIVRRIRAQESPWGWLVAYLRARTNGRPARENLVLGIPVPGKQDHMGLVTGPEGRGKSTWMVKLAKALQVDFSLLDQTSWSARDYLVNSIQLGPGSVNAFDETPDAIDNRRASSSGNVGTNQALMMNRAYRHHQLFAYPRFDGADPYLRDFRVMMWYRVVGMGRVECRMRDWHQPVGDTEHDALKAYPLVARVSFGPERSEEWAEYERRKEIAVDEKILATVRDLEERLDLDPAQVVMAHASA